MKTRDQLQALLRQQPFQPFRVHLRDGRVFEIHYPDINLLGETYIDIGIPEPGNPDPFYDHMVYVPLELVIRIEPVPAAARSA